MVFCGGMALGGEALHVTPLTPLIAYLLPLLHYLTFLLPTFSTSSLGQIIFVSIYTPLMHKSFSITYDLCWDHLPYLILIKAHIGNTFSLFMYYFF